MSDERVCRLCGFTGTRPDVSKTLVSWKDPGDGNLFDAIERCRDRVACRARVELAGEAWPEGHPDPRQASRRLAPAAQPEPSPDVFPSRLETAYASRPPAAATDPSPDLPLWDPYDQEEGFEP